MFLYLLLYPGKENDWLDKPLVGKFQLSVDRYFEIICFGLSNQLKVASLIKWEMEVYDSLH